MSAWSCWVSSPPSSWISTLDNIYRTTSTTITFEQLVITSIHQLIKPFFVAPSDQYGCSIHHFWPSSRLPHRTYILMIIYFFNISSIEAFFYVFEGLQLTCVF
jgi:hypothetical protein